MCVSKQILAAEIYYQPNIWVVLIILSANTVSMQSYVSKSDNNIIIQTAYAHNL